MGVSVCVYLCVCVSVCAYLCVRESVYVCICVCVLSFEKGTDLDGEAGLSAVAAGVTVDAAVEGADAGGVRGEGQVVVRPLAEDGHQVRIERIVLHVRVGCAQDPVGHLPHLETWRKTSHWSERRQLKNLSGYQSVLQPSVYMIYIIANLSVLLASV